MAASKSYTASKEFTESLGANDVPDLLKVFLADVGLDGIEYGEKEMLRKAVERWVAEDVTAALAWAANLPQAKLRRHFQKMMLQELAKIDPFKSSDLALEIESGDVDFDASDIVCAGIAELAKTSGNEREIAELVKKTSVKDSKSSFGLSQSFSDDFSHESLLNALAEIQNQGLKFRFAPTGMLKAWAKRDPEAAHAWSVANGKIGFEEWQDVLDGVASSTGQQASGQWFLGKYGQANEEQRKMMVGAFNDSYQEPAARMVLADSLARQMPSDLAGEFVNQVFEAHLGHSSDNQAEGLSLLSWYPTAEERADALAKNAQYSGVDRFLERFPEARLKPFGVTRELLEAAVLRQKALDTP